MKRAIAWVLLLAAVGVGCGHKTKESSTSSASVVPSKDVQEVGPFRVSVDSRPETPSVGDNTVIVTVQDTLGRPVAGAHVETQVVMEAMGAMPRMESRGVVRESSPGVYESKYGLAMAGEWDLGVRIRSVNGSADATYRLSTSLRGAAFAGGTPPLHAATAGVSTVDESGAVRIDTARRQAIGVKTEAITTRDLASTIRAAGRVAYDETRRTEVSLKFSGWVREIRVDYTGKPVQEGQVLFTAYSPELVSAQQEYLTSLGTGSEGGALDPQLAEAARQRLLRWDLRPSQIEQIARAGKPLEAVPILAPASGIVLEKSVVQGSAFAAGQTLYKIAPIHPLWVLANVYPFELSFVRTGMTATILTPFLAEQSRPGRVSYIDPYLNPETRTAQVRIAVPNPHGDLKPDMFVDVVLSATLGKRLAVPEAAVLYAGDRRVVFVDLGDGRFAPHDVALGAKAGDYYEVTSGLMPGDVVVTSGNFLIAAESRLKSAAQKW